MAKLREPGSFEESASWAAVWLAPFNHCCSSVLQLYNLSASLQTAVHQAHASHSLQTQGTLVCQSVSGQFLQQLHYNYTAVESAHPHYSSQLPHATFVLSKQTH